MTASVLFSSTDPGAPVLDGGSWGTLIDVLYACLVTGYGTKEPLGWSSPFYDSASKTRVFRNNSVKGSGCFLRVSDAGYETQYGNGVTQYFYTLKMHSVMDTVNTGIDPIPSLNYNYGMRYVSQTSVTVKWRLIGDDRGFYFITWPYGPGTFVDAAYVFYVGDIVSLFPDFPIYGLFSNLGTTPWFCASDTAIVSNGTVLSGKASYINRNPITKDYGSVEAMLCPCYPNVGSRFGNSTAYFPLINGIPYGADHVVQISPGKVVGKLPGLYSHLVASTSSVTSQPDIKLYEEFFAVGGNTLLKLVLKASDSTTLVNFPVTIQLRIGQGFR